jgi:hypothetical protein
MCDLHGSAPTGRSSAGTRAHRAAWSTSSVCDAMQQPHAHCNTPACEFSYLDLTRWEFRMESFLVHPDDTDNLDAGTPLHIVLLQQWSSTHKLCTCNERFEVPEDYARLQQASHGHTVHYIYWAQINPSRSTLRHRAIAKYNNQMFASLEALLTLGDEQEPGDNIHDLPAESA